MEDLKVFRVPSGFDRALGRDTLRTRKNWDTLISEISTAPHIMRGVPEESPYIRRFHHQSFLSQRQRGFCVGFNTANSIMTLLRIPLGATANTGTPLPLRQISPLYIYDISRMVASNEGIRLGNGDGGIGSCAIKACHKWGAVELGEYDSSPQAIDQHRNGTVPSSDAIKTGTEHPVNEFSICDSWSHGLEMLGSGFPITLCSEIPEGMMHSDAKGFFRMIGNVVGGHCYAMCDYSKKLNLAWISQAWEGWGEKTTDPTFTPLHGYTQIGTCPLDELERYFDQRKVGSGASEIYVANSVEGWTPKIVDYGPM